MPNIWHSDGTPAITPEDDPEFVPYQPQLRWVPELKGHGYRGIPRTAAEDFAEADLEDLI